MSTPPVPQWEMLVLDTPVPAVVGLDLGASEP